MYRFLSFVLVCFLLLAGVAVAAETAPAHHALVRLYLDDPAAEQFLRQNLARLDVLFVKPGVLAEIAAQPAELELLRASGLRQEIVQPDMEAASRFAHKGAGFGDYHTYSENIAFVDSLRLLHPDVISARWSLGQSDQGNDIWCFRVSDNPDIDENEPEILFDGMHHAREIMASEFPILFAEYLAENYGVDPEITWLVDHRELYIVPIVNPDGVLYNESTDPNGGGMWRKNRRINGDGSYGVDLNRNYPFEWGYDDSGSSPYPSDVTYRGPSAGSEPETQAIMDLFLAHDFVTHNSYHTYSNYTLYPWGYVNAPTADESAFVTLAGRMCQFNGYTPGRPGEILYTVNGGSIDWAYGDRDVLSFSNEIGGSSDGFWPSEARRMPLFQENIWPATVLMRAADAFVTARNAVTTPVVKAIEPGQAGLLDFTLENEGAVASPAATITLRTDDAWLQLDEAQRNLGALAPFTSTTLAPAALPFSVDAGCPNGHYALVDVEIPQSEGVLHSSLSVLVGTPEPLLVEDFESGSEDWTFTGTWALSSEAAFGGFYGLTDSPGGEYDNQTSTSATLTPSFQATRLTFRHKFDIESGWDYGYVQVSTDGQAWNTVYSCTGTQTAWQLVDIDLSDYAGSELQFRFLLDTDYSITEDGWFIDDVSIEGFGSDNLPPTTPVPAEVTGLPDGGATPTVGVENSMDPEGQELTYGFKVYADELCTQPVLSEVDVPEGTLVTSFTITGLEDGDYWWRAWAFDGEERSLLTPPTAVQVQDPSPVDDAIVLNPGLRVLGGVTGRQARLQLDLPRSASVRVDVFDARGARVRSLHSGAMDAGQRLLVWDGRDATGRNVSSGVYFVRMVYGHDVFTGRVVMVR